MPLISKNAIVEKTAELASDVRVGPFTYIGPHVKIGPGCVIENNVSITGRTVLGPKNHIFPMATIGAAPEGGREGECVIGTACAIREHVVVYGGKKAHPTRIANDNLVMIGSQIGEGASLGEHGIFANCSQVGADAVVEDYVRTSGFCVVEAGAIVGAYTFIAGFTGVHVAAPPYAMVQGHPFRVRGVNTQNLRRCGFGEDDIRALKLAFRELYSDSSERPDEEAVARMLAAEDLNPSVATLLQFLQAHPCDDGKAENA
jgi:UDP-N-acetylglucosamine acyltransferase